MVMGAKSQKRKDEMDYRRLLDTTDPFDHLIMELGKDGMLDINTIPIGQNQYPHEPSTYNKKILPPRGKHSS